VSLRSDALSIARGDVRDGVAAIEHFREVLVSRRVGPRVLERAIPEMATGCEPLVVALGALVDAAGAEISDDPEGVLAVQGLVDHAEVKVRELALALQAFVGSTIDARARLSLEGTVRRVSDELGATLRLVDMLGAPVTSDMVMIDLGDALHARVASARRARVPEPQALRVPVELSTEELAVGDARLLMELLDHAVAWVVGAGVSAPRIVVSKGPEGFPMFTIEGGGSGAGQAGQARLSFDTVVRDELPHERGVVRAAARHAGISLSIEDDGRRVIIAL
jgi:hypothetical protein